MCAHHRVTRDTDTQEGHVAGDSVMGTNTNPQEEVASVLNPNSMKSLPVNIAKIVHTSWISVYDLLL